MSRSRGALPITLAIALIVASGCALRATPGPSVSPSVPRTFTHPTGPMDVVVRAMSGGGLLPPSIGLTEMPDVSIYGDGRVVRVGPHGRRHGDPLLPDLIESWLTPGGIQAVLAAAGPAGLLGPDRHYELPAVADLWTVRFTVAADGQVHRVSAYGLGFSDEERYAPSEDLAARRLLQAYYDQLLDLRAWLPAGAIGPDSAHAAAQTRVFVTRLLDWSTGGGATPAPVSPRPDQEVRDWPLSAPPDLFGAPVGRFAEGWRCAVVGPDGIVALGLDTATWDTRWRANGHLYQVVARPLLPDETGCPADT